MALKDIFEELLSLKKRYSVFPEFLLNLNPQNQ